MATYKKQLRDKDNNVIYPAQGLGTITSENIDWTTMRFPAPVNTVLQDIGDVTGNTAIPISYDGFLTGKAITNNTDGHAMVNLANSDDGPFLGGIPYCSPNAVQVAFCIPCHAGQTFYARCGNGRLERVKIVKAEF